MARDEVFQPLTHTASARFGGAAVDNHAQRIDRISIDHDAHFDEIAGTVADLVIVE